MSEQKQQEDRIITSHVIFFLISGFFQWKDDASPQGV